MSSRTVGTLSPAELPFETARRIEQHRFDSVRRVRYRNADLDFSSPNALLAALEAPPPAPYFAAVPDAVDLSVLRALLLDPLIARQAHSHEILQLLWSVCQVPDFRHILFEVHLELLRELFGALQKGPLSNDFLAARTQELAHEEGGVDTLVARISRLRTWAFVANQAGFCADPGLWSARLGDLEDQLSDALHRGLVSTFVERRGKARPPAPRQDRKAASVSDEPNLDRHHPFAALKALRGSVHEPAPAATVRSDFADLVDAPHSAFALDAEGRVFAGGALLGKLVRGANLVEPNVQLAALDVGAGVQSRLERRLLAFARDSVGRLLEGLRDLEQSERPALRAIAYQLTRGLGSASASELGASLEQLDEPAFASLRAAGVRMGHLSVFLPKLLQRGALERRATLVHVFEPQLKLPKLGRSHYQAQSIAGGTWRCLGYLALGPWACRVDLAERAAQAFSEGATDADTLRHLSLPRRDAAEVTRALKHAILPARALSS
jgi:ATP-dependent RNA helicase SUPV3L1/SUV3